MQTLKRGRKYIIDNLMTVDTAKSNLYTGTGDSGTTSLVGGTRIPKNSVRLEAYGTIDEFSSFLGRVLSNPECDVKSRQQLLEIQNFLFDMGAYLATESPRIGEAISDESKARFMTQGVIAKIEGWIDELDASVPKIRAFVLPGGTILSADTQIARTVCRRAERRILELATQYYVDPSVIKYVNRLSDYLFILARHFNHIAGVEDIVWRPAH